MLRTLTGLSFLKLLAPLVEVGVLCYCGLCCYLYCLVAVVAYVVYVIGDLVAELFRLLLWSSMLSD